MSEKKEESLCMEQERIRKNIAGQYTVMRKEMQLTQADIAKKMNVKRPNISRFESGQYNPTIDMLVKLADCLDMELVVEFRKNKGE